MASRAWLIAGLVVAVAVSTDDAAGPVLVFDFDCADPATFPMGKISVDVDPEVLRLGGKAWADRAVSADLNRDGRPEFFVPTFCGATGNCDWVVFAIDPSRSVGKISGARVYVEDAGDPWLQITAYVAAGAGHGFVSVHRMSGSAYSEVSSREVQDPENGPFLEGMGEPFCRAESGRGTGPVVLPKPLTAEFLAGIKEIPFGKQGAYASDDYLAIVRHGVTIVPELIDLLDDATVTEKSVPLFGGYYSVGDVAMTVISDIIIDVPWLNFITTPDDPRIKAAGFGVYWAYVRESPDNRAQLKERTAAWYRSNEGTLVWRPIPEIASGGVFELPGATRSGADN